MSDHYSNSDTRGGGSVHMKSALAGLLGLLLLTGLCAAADKVGLYDPVANRWYLDSNGNGAWDGAPADASYWFGYAGAIPVVGDWNGTGASKIGIYDPATFAWYLDINANGVWDGEPTDKYGFFGLTGGTPVVGDWNGDGTTKIGMFKNSAWYLDYNGNGYWDGEPTDKYMYFIVPGGGDFPVTGDWNGDGKTEIGMYINGIFRWYLDYNGNGKWDGAPSDVIYFVAWPGAYPVTGDWNGDGKTKIGFYDPYANKWYLHNGDGTLYVQYWYGFAGLTPVTGNW